MVSTNKYIQLNTYGEAPSLVSNFIMTTLVIVIAALTAGAMVGIDITNFNTAPTQQSK